MFRKCNRKNSFLILPVIILSMAFVFTVCSNGSNLEEEEEAPNSGSSSGNSSGAALGGGGVVPVPVPIPTISSWQELKAKIETTGITTETIPLDPAGNWAAHATITVASGQDITLTAASNVTITRDSGASFQANFFQVDAGGTLKLGTAGMGGSIILDGAVAPNANDPIIYVDGTLEMNSSVTLRKNINPVSGGAVYIFAGGKFAMNGGEISQNESQNDGGAVHLSGTSAVNYAEFTMMGGSIIGNKAQNGGGVISYYGKFKMSGGSISGNETTSALGDGGGVYVYDSTFDMDGGDIYGNKAYRGGGVYNNSGDFNMNGGNVGPDNEAILGGGVAIGSFSGNFNMANNAAIKDNLAGSIVSPSGGQGGGVWIDNGGTFVMSGGVISGNRAVYAFGSGDGGGVYLEDPASLTKTGGTIHGVNPASLSPLADPCTEESSGDSNMIVDGGSGAFLPVIIYGHAVYSDSPSQRRVSTAGSTMGTGNPQFWLE